MAERGEVQALTDQGPHERGACTAAKAKATTPVAAGTSGSAASSWQFAQEAAHGSGEAVPPASRADAPEEPTHIIYGDVETATESSQNGSDRSSTRQELKNRAIQNCTRQPLHDEAEAAQPERREGLKSTGAILHGGGNCRPCAWVWKPDGCRWGVECFYCHECPPNEIHERRKAKHEAMKRERRARRELMSL